MKNSKKILCLLSLMVIAYFLVIGSVNAEDQTGIINHKDGAPLLEAQIDNETYYGVCLDHDKKYAYNTTYKITNNSGNTSDHVKNIIIKYYRENNTDRYNSLIQYTVWSSIKGEPIIFVGMTAEEVGICLQMYNDQTGVVGNTYTDENGVKYIFTFNYATPTTDTTRQNVLLFSYVTEIEENPNPQDPNTNNQTIVPKEPEDPINPVDPREPEDSINPSESKKLVTPMDPNESKKSLNYLDPLESKNHAIASMKTTGMPILAVLLVLLSSLGFVIRKNKQ